MADLDSNILYLITSFFGILIVAFIWIYAVNGAFQPTLVNIINGGSLIDMGDTKAEVLGGIANVDLTVKIFFPALFLCTLSAVVIYLFFKKEMENRTI